MLIYPITCSSVIKLVFVRGCNYQLPWHTPLLVVCTLPQYPAPNRRKHSSAALKSGKKMTENRAPLWSSLWSESCFTFLFVQGKCRKSVPKRHCFQALAAWAAKHQEAEKRKQSQKETWQQCGGGTAKGESQTWASIPCRDGWSHHLGCSGQDANKEPSRTASTNGISATLTHLNPSSPNVTADQLQLPPQNHRDGRATVSSHSQSNSSHLLQEYCNSCACQLVHWAQSSPGFLMLF